MLRVGQRRPGERFEGDQQPPPASRSRWPATPCAAWSSASSVSSGVSPLNSPALTWRPPSASATASIPARVGEIPPLSGALNAQPPRNSISTSASPLMPQHRPHLGDVDAGGDRAGQVVGVQPDPGEPGRGGGLAPLDEGVPGRLDEARAGEGEEARDQARERRRLARGRAAVASATIGLLSGRASPDRRPGRIPVGTPHPSRRPDRRLARWW